LIIVGFKVLNPQYIDWLSSNDPLLHYLGWSFFRLDDWRFPLGINPLLGVEISSSIVFSDSIPLLAIPFKFATKGWTENFQYFGIWTLSCFVLQAIFSWKIAEYFSKSLLIKVSVIGLFIFSPPMIWRIGMHSALVGHFFLLAAIFLCIKKYKVRNNIYWSILIVTSVLVHFYLFVMVLALWIFSYLDQLAHKSIGLKEFLRQYLSLVALVPLAVWQAGYISGEPVGGEWGYGIFVFNPLSILDSNGWSYFPSLVSLNEQDSFQYLGMGMIILAIFTLPKLLIHPRIIVRILIGNPFVIFSPKEKVST
jgi:hypothetical protein